MKRALLITSVLITVFLLVLVALPETNPVKTFIYEVEWRELPQQLKDDPEEALETGPMDERKYIRNARRFFKKTMLADYEKYGDRSYKWNKKARALIETHADLRLPRDQDFALHRQVDARGMELLGMGCDDALIKYIMANARFQAFGLSQARIMLEQSIEFLENSRYPALYKFYAAHGALLAYRRTRHTSEDLQEIIRKRDIYLAQAAADTRFANGNQRYLIDDVLRLYTPVDDELPQKPGSTPSDFLLKELASTPDADPWIKFMIQGVYHRKKGWAVRGGGLAVFVNEEDWAPFKNELELARDRLTRAHALHPEFPEAASLMISIATADPANRFEERQWFAHATAAQFDYMPAYYKYLWALRPRWGGSHEQMLQFGLECLNTGRYDTRVPYLFIESLWDVGTEMPDWRDLFQAPGTLENLERYFSGTLNEPNRSDLRDFDTTTQGILYWAAGQYEKAKTVFDELGAKVYKPLFPTYGIKQKRVMAEIDIYTGPFRNNALQAAAFYDAGQLPEALPLYESLRKNLQGKKEALQIIDERIATLRLKEDYLKGGWVDLISADKQGIWEPKGGKAAIKDDGSLSVSGNMVLCRFPVTDNYELRGEIETSDKATIVMGYKRGTIGAEFLSFSLLAGDNKVQLAAKFKREPETVEKELPVLKKNNFLLRVENERITAFVNGEQVFTGREIDHIGWSAHNGRIGLSGLYTYPGSHILVRYSKLQIRKTGEYRPAPDQQASQSI